MTLTPEDLQRIMAEGAKADAKDIEDALKQTIEDGWLVWPTGTDSQELGAFKAWTLPGDDALVLTSDYLPLMKAGVLPRLECMDRQAAWEKAQAEAAQMLPPADLVLASQPYEPTFFWSQLITKLPPFVFEHYAGRFRSLVRAEIKKVTA